MSNGENMNKGYTLFELLVAVLMLGFFGLIGWVLVHFISKFW